VGVTTSYSLGGSREKRGGKKSIIRSLTLERALRSVKQKETANLDTSVRSRGAAYCVCRLAAVNHPSARKLNLPIAKR